MSSDDEETPGDKKETCSTSIEKRKAGRPVGSLAPFKLTDQFIHDYKLLCEGGVPPKKACEQLGVAFDTVKKWKRLGRLHIEQNAPSSLYSRLAEAAATAETQLGRQALMRIRDEIKNPNSKSGAKLSAWVAERVYPDEYGPPKQRTEHVSTQHVFKHEGLSLGQMMRMLRPQEDQDDESLLLPDHGHADDDSDTIDVDWEEAD